MELTRRRDASAFTDLFHASSTRPALRTLDGGAITHAELAAFVLGFDDSALVAAGVSRQQRVCCGLDSGLEMALMFCTVAAKGYVFAPLSRALARCEYEFEYEDLPAACLIVHENDVDGDMIAVAMKRGLPVIEARPRIGGLFVDLCLRQAGREMGRAFTQSATSASDVAMVLHTSGTTSKPKTVPLTHGNLSAGSQFIAQTLRLEPTDVCLNVMPLFHIHGLAVNLLATLVSGSSVILAPGLAQLGLEGFFDVLEKRRPTWYSAVPTMHQAIASFREDAAISRRETKEDSTSSIVLVRNCSAALLPTVARRLEKVFQGSTVLPTYAMSESMPICSNPRFGQPRKLESVGPAAGPQVFIVDAETSNEAVQGAEGEVCVFGPCVTAGYELRAGRPDPNTFVQVRALKCLRTGDKGFFDTDGHLHLVGRFKEVVNRGGEKFSPFPVEDALLSHAAVRQVVAFAAPHALLGEVMAVAVVCEAGRVTTLAELRSWATASGTVNARALPEVCVIVPEIPVGPTGKPARIGLAKRLGLDAEAVQSSQDAVFDVGPGTVGEARLRRVMLVQQRKPRACIEAGPDDEVKEEDAVEDMDSLSMMRGRTSHARAAPRASARHMQSHAYAICMFALLFNWCVLVLERAPRGRCRQVLRHVKLPKLAPAQHRF
ncbi:hypothetical protein M885DRAFT_264097 [Pelagophyceae sp. CCMP2097]|nr:hypothetical protein M885DRAFT_264097 [Pelagophyceae sp. CCMP2097]